MIKKIWSTGAPLKLCPLNQWESNLGVDATDILIVTSNSVVAIFTKVFREAVLDDPSVLIVAHEKHRMVEVSACSAVRIVHNAVHQIVEVGAGGHVERTKFEQMLLNDGVGNDARANLGAVGLHTVASKWEDTGCRVQVARLAVFKVISIIIEAKSTSPRILILIRDAILEHIAECVLGKATMAAGWQIGRAHV